MTSDLDDADRLVAAMRDLVASMQMFRDADASAQELLPGIKDRDLRMELAIEMEVAEDPRLFANELLSSIENRPLRSTAKKARSKKKAPKPVDEPQPGVTVESLLREQGIDLDAIAPPLNGSNQPRKRNMTHVILDRVRSQPGLTRNGIAKAIGTTAGKVSSSLANLKRWGWIYDEGHTWYPTDKEGMPDLRNVRTKIDARILAFLQDAGDTFQTKEMAVYMKRPGSGLSSSLASLSSRGIIEKINPTTWQINSAQLQEVADGQN